MSGIKLKQMLERKKRIQGLKFQKHIEKMSEDIEKDRTENSSKIKAVREELLECLGNEIEILAEDKQIKILQWINSWIYYLSYEDTFEPSKLMTYKRGDIVHVNFGFNIHNELGGAHYAIVVEVDNPSKSGCVTVVPLRSEDTEEEALKSMHERTEVYLGSGIVCFGSGKNKYTVAKVNQIRAIDKMRILMPKNDKKHTVYPIDSEMRKDILNKIDKKIIELFTKPQKSVDKSPTNE